MGREAGIEERQLQALGRYRESDVFSDLEKAVLDYTSGLCGLAVDIPDDVFDELKKGLTDGQILELTQGILLDANRARMNRALGMLEDEIPDGAYCLIEDAVAEPTRPMRAGEI